MNPSNPPEQSNRILLIDDNPAIHEDIKKILCPVASDNSDLSAAENALFGSELNVRQQSDFEIDSAFQGREGLKMVEKALADGRPYSMAFVDVRMPPGWDGVETIRHIWNQYPDLQVVICTAYSDHSWAEIIRQLGKTDSLVILKKPFDNVEVLQLAHALTKKWLVTRQARIRLEDLEAIVKRRTQELVHANEQLHREIERRASVETSLRESEERFHKSFEAASVALAILRADNLQHLDVNESYLALTGYGREVLMGKNPAELHLPVNPAQIAEAIKALQVGYQIQNLEVDIRRADNQIRHTIVCIVPVTLAEGPCYLAALTDVTSQRKLESQLRQAQKMEAIGQLAAGVAHDFNNLLTIILGHSSIQLAKANLEKEIAHSFEQVKMASERAASLTRQLLNFSRKQVVNRKAVDLTATLQRMKNMLPRLLGENIKLRCAVMPDLPLVNADDSSMDQVIMNLVVNARDAMSVGGEVFIEAICVELSGNDQRGVGRFVKLSVKDTGCGMDEKTQQRIFEPFFTTKPVGQGTGLGLSTVYAIVKQHDGWIDVQSTMGEGTTFQIFLPVSTEASIINHDAHRPETLTVVKSGDAKILVVEDEAPVRAYICAVLRQNGFKVYESGDGEEAIRVWENAGRTFDLLLTDMVMPGNVNGKALASRLLKQKPNLQVIYMTGYSADILASGKTVEEGVNFLPKPFTRDQLLCATQEALSSSIPALPLSEVALA